MNAELVSSAGSRRTRTLHGLAMATAMLSLLAIDVGAAAAQTPSSMQFHSS
jgi:hypothetical protein